MNDSTNNAYRHTICDEIYWHAYVQDVSFKSLSFSGNTQHMQTRKVFARQNKKQSLQNTIGHVEH